MTYTDPYRLTGDGRAAQHSGTAADAAPVTLARVVRTLLWLVLVVSVVANTVASSVGAAIAVHLACGAVTACCVTGLVVQRLRGRR
jgi:hypothetical protein